MVNIWIISGASIWATSCWVQKINIDLMNRLCQEVLFLHPTYECFGYISLCVGILVAT